MNVNKCKNANIIKRFCFPQKNSEKGTPGVKNIPHSKIMMYIYFLFWIRFLKGFVRYLFASLFLSLDESNC